MRNYGDAAIQFPLNAEILAGQTNLFQRCSLRPYDSRVCTFLQDFSQTLMGDTAIKTYPDAVTFAFFCRSSNIKRLQSEYESHEIRIRRGCGIVFHVAPSNVPINFAYSFVFALLAGCSSVVRVSSREYGQVSAICRILNQTLKRHQDILKMMLIIRYEHDDDVNIALSSLSDGRVIWGGDATVSLFRKYPVKSRCIDIAFPDRHSLGLVKSEAILGASENELGKLAQNFYNDTYLMDQNACSSPHILLWTGKNFPLAQTRFWGAVAKIAAERYHISPVLAVDKLTKLYSDAVSVFPVQYEKYENLLYVLTLERFPEPIDHFRGQGGYFYQLEWNDMKYFFKALPEKIQTLTYFGFDSDEIKKMLQDFDAINIDRIVPIGKALDISVHWDGYDIVLALSRIKDIV